MSKPKTTDTHDRYFQCTALREDGLSIYGTVDSPQGTVSVDSYAGDGGSTMLWIIVGGVRHRRTVRGCVYQKRGLTALARRFAREVGEK